MPSRPSSSPASDTSLLSFLGTSATRILRSCAARRGRRAGPTVAFPPSRTGTAEKGMRISATQPLSSNDTAASTRRSTSRRRSSRCRSRRHRGSRAVPRTKTCQLVVMRVEPHDDPVRDAVGVAISPVSALAIFEGSESNMRALRTARRRHRGNGPRSAPLRACLRRGPSGGSPSRTGRAPVGLVEAPSTDLRRRPDR